MINLFENLFKKEKLYQGSVVDLRESYRTDEKTAFDGVKTIYYHIFLHDKNIRVGSIELRFSIAGYMYYYGHVGYRIMKIYQGHHYAYEACKILFEIAYKQCGMEELIITCSPENIASKKTLLKLNGELMEIVDVPKDHELYARGEKKKMIFKYKLG